MNKIIYILFFLSGFTGLSYEVIWQKKLLLTLGADASSYTAIFISFFIGIGFGGKVGDYLLKRYKRPLKLYAILEVIISLWAILVPTVLILGKNTYVSILHNFQFHELFWLRFIIAIICILPATLCMGATIPVMSASLRRQNNNGVQLAYGLNLVGAMIGIATTAFLLLPKFGMNKSHQFIYILNFILAFVAWKLSKLEKSFSQDWSEKIDQRLKLTYLLSGLVALGAEIVWLRIIALFTTNGHIVFSTVLFIYLLGFSLGSLFLSPFLLKRFSKELSTTFVLFGVPASILITLPFLKISPLILEQLVLERVFAGNFSYSFAFIAEAYPAISAILLPAIFMGATFPTLSFNLKEVGQLYFYGNIGSVIGVIFFSLLLIPQIGLIYSFSFLIILSSLNLWLSPYPLSKKFHWYNFALILISLGYSYFSYPFIKNNFLQELTSDGFIESKDGKDIAKVLRYKEGKSATVIVREHYSQKNFRSIYVDEQQVAGSSPSGAVDSKMLAHLPIMLHHNPQSALTVGYGSGGTSWSMALYPLNVYVLEIEPEVIKSAHLFPEYFDVFQKSNFHYILNDARDRLTTTKNRYDIISTDVTNLQYKQNPNLYTVEYFNLIKDRLNDNGIACAWIPITAISPIELKILLKSFYQAFPHTTFWYMHQIHTTFGILIGTKNSLNIDFERLRTLFKEEKIKQDLEKINISGPEQLLSFLILDERGMENYTKNASIHSDDLPILEYTSTYSYYRNQEHLFKNLDELSNLAPTSIDQIVNVSDKKFQQLISEQFAQGKSWRKISILTGLAFLKENTHRKVALLEEALNETKYLTGNENAIKAVTRFLQHQLKGN